MRTVLISLAIACASTNASAQVKLRPIETDTKKSWTHEQTKVELPAELAGMTRMRVADTGQAELDVIVNYASADDKDLLSLYLFKPQIVSAPLWMDRALDMIMLRDDFGLQGTARPQPLAFPPQDAQTRSGMRVSLSIRHSKYRASGLAIVPVGQWLVKARLSSSIEDVSRVDRLLTEILGTLRIPAGGPEAVAIKACEDSITFTDVKPLVHRKEDRMAHILAAAVVGGWTKPSVTYCKSGGPVPAFAVYRPLDTRGEYVAALADAGRSIVVRPDFAVGSGPKGSSVTLLDIGRTLVHGSFEAVPEPQQLLGHVLGRQPLAMSELDGNALKTTILSSSIQ